MIVWLLDLKYKKELKTFKKVLNKSFHQFPPATDSHIFTGQSQLKWIGRSREALFWCVKGFRSLIWVHPLWMQCTVRNQSGTKTVALRSDHAWPSVVWRPSKNNLAYQDMYMCVCASVCVKFRAVRVFTLDFN